ncbi:MAG: TolC family protein [Bdellovibrionales bacterium]|nr:TolC family protein [Bdellovibrionales bacterium]
MEFLKLVILSVIISRSGAGEKLGFYQALELALEKSPQYKSLILTDRNAVLSEKNAWTSFFPNLELNATHTYTQQNTSLYNSNSQHNPWANQAGFSLTENLYDNGDSWRFAQVSSLKQKIEAINLEGGRSRLLADVAKSFYDFSSAYGVLELQKQQIEALNVQFHTIEIRYQQGLKNSRDFLRIKAQLQSAEIGFISQKINLENLLSNLRTTIGEDQQTDFIPLTMEKLNIEHLQSLTTDPELTFEYRVSHFQSEISALKYESFRRTEWPRLSLKGSYNYVVPQYFGPKTVSDDKPFWNFTFLLIVDYPLWDWGQTSRKIEIAENQKKLEETSQYQSRLQVKQNLFSIKKQAHLLMKSLQLSDLILKTNEEAFRSLNQGYKNGRVNFLELVTTLNDLYSSRIQNLNLHFSLLKIRTEWAHNQGKIDEILKIH